MNTLLILFHLISGALGCYLLSSFIFLSFRSYMLPNKSIFKEQIFFDFNQSNPLANVNLLTNEKQWYYAKTLESISEPKVRFMNKGFKYSIVAQLVLSKSPTNDKLSKFMLNTQAYSALDEKIAESLRPIIVPYRSVIINTLEVIAFSPFCMLDFFDFCHSNVVDVELMNDYLEQIVPTKSFLFSLSTNQPDIQRAYLVITPKMSFLL